MKLKALRAFCMSLGIPRVGVTLFGRHLVRVRVPREHVDAVRMFVKSAQTRKRKISVRRLWPFAHDHIDGFHVVLVVDRVRMGKQGKQWRE